MSDEAEPGGTVRKPDPATAELLLALALGVVVALVALIVFPGLVTTVLDIVAEIIGRATGEG